MSYTYSSQLLGGDGAVSILVEQGESLLELGNLFLSQLISLHNKNSSVKVQTKTKFIATLESSIWLVHSLAERTWRKAGWQKYPVVRQFSAGVSSAGSRAGRPQ